MAIAIVTVYVMLVMAGRRTIEQVPEQLRQDVLDELAAKGYNSSEG